MLQSHEILRIYFVNKPTMYILQLCIIYDRKSAIVSLTSPLLFHLDRLYLHTAIYLDPLYTRELLPCLFNNRYCFRITTSLF